MELLFFAMAVAIIAALLAVALQSHREGPAVAQPDVCPAGYVVFDLETTGLDLQKSEIIEIGAIKILGESQQIFQTLVKPRRRIPVRIAELTGISQAMVDKDGRPLSDALQDFAAFVEDLPLVAFNAHYDMTFLRRSAKRHHLRFSNAYTCALKMSRRAWPTQKSHRLAVLAKQFNLSEEDTHRALADCRRTLEVYKLAANRLGRAPYRSRGH
jgi:DNA polymerase III epsilon subunit family exonuclease